MQKSASKTQSKTLDHSDDDMQIDNENHKEMQQLYDNSLRNRFVTEVKSAEKSFIKMCTDAWKVCHYNQLPKWLQDNEFIINGHRPPLPSYSVCLKSIFRLHTETGNIWSHGLGCILFLALAIYIFTFTFAEFKTMDKIMFAIYFTGAVTCLLLSTLYHTCSCHSPNVRKVWHKFDYCGISIQIIGSTIPGQYYSFYHRPTFAFIYIACGFIFFAMAVTVSLYEKFGTPQYRPIRTGVFIAFGLSNVFPGIHWYLTMEPKLLTFFICTITQGALYIFGAVLYAMRVPERFFPGKCDYWFQAHQIFHVFVVFAALVHLYGLYSGAMIRLTEDPVYINE